MSNARTNSAESPAVWAHEYTSFASDIDLTTDTSGPKNNLCARGIIVTAVGSGTLVVTLRDGTSKTFANAGSLVGLLLPLQVKVIEDGSDIGACIVLW